jgi:hypothetical protein
MRILKTDQLEKAANDESMTPEAILAYIAKHKSSIINVTKRELKRKQIDDQLWSTDWKECKEKSKLQKD